MAVRGGETHHWQDQKAEREQMRQREHPTGHQRRLAIGLGGSAGASASERAGRGVHNGADKDAESNDDREENGEEHLLPVRPEPHA